MMPPRLCVPSTVRSIRVARCVATTPTRQAMAGQPAVVAAQLMTVAALPVAVITVPEAAPGTLEVVITSLETIAARNVVAGRRSVRTTTVTTGAA